MKNVFWARLSSSEERVAVVAVVAAAAVVVVAVAAVAVVVVVVVARSRISATTTRLMTADAKPFKTRDTKKLSLRKFFPVTKKVSFC